jgi:hypothetical protein
MNTELSTSQMSALCKFVADEREHFKSHGGSIREMTSYCNPHFDFEVTVNDLICVCIELNKLREKGL